MLHRWESLRLQERQERFELTRKRPKNFPSATSWSGATRSATRHVPGLANSTLSRRVFGKRSSGRSSVSSPWKQTWPRRSAIASTIATGNCSNHTSGRSAKAPHLSRSPTTLTRRCLRSSCRWTRRRAPRVIWTTTSGSIKSTRTPRRQSAPASWPLRPKRRPCASVWPCSIEKKKRSEEHTSELQSQSNLVCRLLLEKKKKNTHRSRQRHRTLYEISDQRH